VIEGGGDLSDELDGVPEGGGALQFTSASAVRPGRYSMTTDQRR
jgi:hypothetical protein